MKKLLSLLVLVSVIFTLQNCINQENEMTEENFSNTILKKATSNVNNNVNTKKSIINLYYVNYSSNVTEAQKENIRDLFIDAQGEYNTEINSTKDKWHIYDIINLNILRGAVNNCVGCMTIETDENEPTSIISVFEIIDTSTSDDDDGNFDDQP